MSEKKETDDAGRATCVFFVEFSEFSKFKRRFKAWGGNNGSARDGEGRVLGVKFVAFFQVVVQILMQILILIVD
jgi:hypothetical protein